MANQLKNTRPQNLQNLLESTVGTEDDNFGDELKIFDESREVFDFKVPEQIAT